MDAGRQGRGTFCEGSSACLDRGLAFLSRRARGSALPPWAPGRREEVAHLEHGAGEKIWCLSEVDIFRDLSSAEMDAIAEAAPMRTYAAGEMLYSPNKSVEKLFILKQGRVRIFRVSPDGRALTTSIVDPGTIFGELPLLGQRMYDNFAEAMDESVACEMSESDVHRFLLADPRIARRIAEILSARLAEMERRLSDSVFKTVPQRIALTLVTLSGQERRLGLGGRTRQVALTHEQIAALAGTSRETATKVLGEFAERRLIQLGRGRVTVIDPEGIARQTGD